MTMRINMEYIYIYIKLAQDQCFFYIFLKIVFDKFQINNSLMSLEF